MIYHRAFFSKDGTWRRSPSRSRSCWPPPTTLGAAIGAGGAAARPPEVDACAVLTRAEIEPTFGPLKGVPLRDTGLRNEKLCTYSNTAGSWLRMSLYGADRWGVEKGATSERKQKELAGIGNEAFSIKRGTDSVVYVKKGGGVLELSCSCDLAKAEALARKAAPRI